jgi:tetratricopeptide (TPR) repeat protein
MKPDSMRPRRARLLVLTAWLAAVVCGAAAAAPGQHATGVADAPTACNAFNAQANDALQRRSRGDLVGAKAVADEILRQDPNDFRANYTEALILLIQSGLDDGGKYDKQKAADGIAGLVKSVALLDKMTGACLATAKALGWGSIYNSLGAFYFNASDMASAERTWLDAYKSKRPLMTAKTQGLLLRNLGLLYRQDHLGKPDQSARYYGEALALEQKSNPAVLAAPVQQLVTIPIFKKN